MEPNRPFLPWLVRRARFEFRLLNALEFGLEISVFCLRRCDTSAKCGTSSDLTITTSSYFCSDLGLSTYFLPVRDQWGTRLLIGKGANYEFIEGQK